MSEADEEFLAIMEQIENHIRSVYGPLAPPVPAALRTMAQRASQDWRPFTITQNWHPPDDGGPGRKPTSPSS